MHDFQEDHTAYHRASVICSIISLVTTALVLLTYYLIRKKVANFFYNLGICLLLADIPLLVTSVLDAEALSEPVFCNIIGPLRVYSNTSIAIWNVLICWTVHSTIKDNLSEDDLQGYRRRFLLIGFVLPIVFGVLPFATEGYIETFTSCWISTKARQWEQFLMNAICYWVPILGCLTYVAVITFRVIKFLKKFAISEVSGEFYALGLYPVVFLLCNMADIFDRVYITLGMDLIVWIAYTHVIMRQLQCFFYGVVFLFNPRVREEIVALFKRPDFSQLKSDVSFVVNSNSKHSSMKDEVGTPDERQETVMLSLQPGSIAEEEKVLDQKLLSKYFQMRTATEAEDNMKKTDESSIKSFLSDTT